MRALPEDDLSSDSGTDSEVSETYGVLTTTRYSSLESGSHTSSDDPTPIATSNRYQALRRYLIFLGLATLPTISTLSDTAEVFFSIDDVKGELLAFHLLLNEDNLLPVQIIAPSLFFLSSLALNTHWTLIGMNVVYHIYKNKPLPSKWPELTFEEIAHIIDEHALPPEWPELETLSSSECSDIINQLHARKFRTDWIVLSKKKQALLLAILMSSAVIDAINAEYYLNTLIQENVDTNNKFLYYRITLSSFIAAMYGFTNIFGEGVETIGTLIKKESLLFSSPISEFITKLLNYTATVIGSITTAIEDFFPIVISLGASTPLAKSAILAWVTTKFLTDYCLGRANCYDAIEEFTSFFSSKEREKRSYTTWVTKTGLFSVTLYSAFFLADLQRAFFMQLLHNPLAAGATLPFEMPEWLIEGLGRSRSVRDFVVNAYFLNPFFEACFNILTYVPKKMIHGLSQCCKKDTTEPEEGKELLKIISSPTPTSLNRSTLFYPSTKDIRDTELGYDEENSQEKDLAKKSACVVL